MSQNETDRSELAAKLAGEIFELSRNTILVNMRFMDAAISRLSPEIYEGESLATNGAFVYYNPIYVLSRYRASSTVAARDLLHVMMHCVFRHMFVDPSIDRTIWDLSCDIAVEEIITSLDLKSFETPSVYAQKSIIGELRGKLRNLSADRIYRYFMDKELSYDDAAKLREAFISDEHTLWYRDLPEEKEGEKVPSDDMSDSDSVSGTEGEEADSGDEGEKGGEREVSGDEVLVTEDDDYSDRGSSLLSEQSMSALEDDWKKVSERMEEELENFAKVRSGSADGLLQSLRQLNRERYDYDQFLKKFAVRHEVMRINDDEFDYIFYTYGLKLYKKMPLVEPLEYREQKRIRDFVIAIDTSGSVSGELVQTFVQKTFNILTSTESFASRVNVHIVQCDAEIQEHVKITTKEEFNDYIEHMTIKGMGGTDFRPVFDLVDSLLAAHEFTNLKGLIYFTDGDGVYPGRKPDYDCAFVFLEDEFTDIRVPPWAMKVILEKEDISEEARIL